LVKRCRGGYETPGSRADRFGQVWRALDTSLINISRINNTLMFSSSTQS
jgi:hypothetical protein